jgi:hypothetical protein
VELEKMKDMFQESQKIIQRSAPRVIGENVEISVYLVEDFLKIPEYNMTDVHPDAHFTWYYKRFSSILKYKNKSFYFVGKLLDLMQQEFSKNFFRFPHLYPQTQK